MWGFFCPMDVTVLTLDAMVYSIQNRNLNYITHFIHSFKKAWDWRQKRKHRHSLNSLIVPCVAKACFCRSTKGKYLIDHRSEGGGEIIWLILPPVSHLSRTCPLLQRLQMMETAELCWALRSGALLAAAVGRVGLMRMMMAIDGCPLSEKIV